MRLPMIQTRDAFLLAVAATLSLALDAPTAVPDGFVGDKASAAAPPETNALHISGTYPHLAVFSPEGEI